MGRLSSWLFGLGLGAGLMYFLDPDLGDKRKAMVRDRLTRMQNQGDEAVEAAVNDMRNRVRGILSNGMAMVSEENLPDQAVEARIRARMGLLARHPGDVMLTVQNGRVALEGNMLQNEVEGFVSGIQRMKGVREVQNNLHLHQDAGDNPHLQGEGSMFGEKMAQWSPSTRLLVGIGASYLLLYGMVRGGLVGLAARLSGLVLGSRAISNLDLRSLTGAPTTGEAVNVRKSLNVNAPVEEVYQLWSNFENFPQFMSNIEEIRDMGNGRSHWVVKGPLGAKVEFDAVVTENIPNQVLAWETTPESQIQHNGKVNFKGNQKGTQLNVNMAYTPPAGAAGHAVAKMFGKDPKAEMNADLARLKSLLEEGKTTAKNQRVTREQVMPVTGGTGVTGNDQESGRRREDDERIDWDEEDRDASGGMGGGPLTPNDI
jgi:uncharacterized membrane protein